VTARIRVDRRHPEPAAIRQAAQCVRDGLIVAYPTDTLYALAVDPRNAAAVQRLYSLKGRPETAGGKTVGIRVPDHAVAVDFARAADFCITATSANRSGEPAPATPDEVLAAVPGVDAILDAGPARGGAPSTIVGVLDRDVTLIRAGAVPWERVLTSLK
jgi:L-threonylcarbamoyladenylate synthase